ncbi:MAG: NUDIX domain-containing protein [Cyclonatronaceae bacterium]
MSGDRIFGGHLRVRVNGLIISDSRLLLVEIASPSSGKIFWMPPGGGVGFGETLKDALIREIDEETGLQIEPVKLRYVTEYIRHPYHAVEMYYSCRITGGQTVMGYDPELEPDRQIIKNIRWADLTDLGDMHLYPEFLKTRSVEDISDVNGETLFIES